MTTSGECNNHYGPATDDNEAVRHRNLSSLGCLLVVVVTSVRVMATNKQHRSMLRTAVSDGHASALEMGRSRTNHSKWMIQSRELWTINSLKKNESFTSERFAAQFLCSRRERWAHDSLHSRESQERIQRTKEWCSYVTWNDRNDSLVSCYLQLTPKVHHTHSAPYKP
jgi:hypothetical protein